MSKCPYNASADPCEFEVQLMVANVAEEEATETFHEMDAEINKLLRRIHLLEDLIAKKRYPCTGTRRLTSALSAFLLAELFTGMEVGRGGLNIPTGWPNLFVQMELRFLDVRLCRFRP